MVTISRLTTLLSFVIALAGILPVWPWLELFPRLAAMVGLLSGVLQEVRGRWRFKSWQAYLVLVLLSLWYIAQYSRSNPVQPVVSMLVVMLAVRMGGEKSVRNLLQINLLAIICLASRSLYDLSPQFLVWLALLLLLLPVSLVLLTFHAQDATLSLNRHQMGRVIAVALLMTVITVPVMVGLFPILPRTAFPLWNLYATAHLGSTGLSDKVTPGASAIAGVSQRPAFRAEIIRQPQQPYWRGTVFNRVTEAGWSRTAAVPPEIVVQRVNQISQTIYPEPSSSRFLVGLDATTTLSLPRSRMAPDRVFEHTGELSRRISYTARSDASGVLRTKGTIRRDFYLTIPESLSPQIQELARRIRQQGGSDAERLALTEQHFLNGGYRYSRGDLPTGADALDTFLFASKQGHCEFFASACAIVLRAAGVPARLVGGYLGGDYNELGGYYLVSEEQAHVWVEAYLAGRGWVRTDPSRFAVNAGQVWDQQRKTGIIMRLKLLIDVLDYRWNRTIVTYDFERQVQQIRTVGMQLQTLEQKITLKRLAIILCMLAFPVALVLLGRRGQRLWESREQRLLRRFMRIVKQRFGDRIQTENRGLFEIAAAAGDDRIHRFVSLYGSTIYQDRRLTSEEARSLHRLLDEMLTVDR